MKSMWLRGKLAKISRQKRIFVFGYPQAGKTTFLACLVRHLRDSNGTTLRVNPVDNPKGAILIEKWLETLDSGNFPEKATDLNYWQNVEVGYRRAGEENARIFIFQEIAGETAIKFDPTHAEHYSLDQATQDFLLDSSGVLIIASATPDVTEEKFRISYFLELLYRASYERPILFLVTKFDNTSTNDSPARVAKKNYSSSVDLLMQDSKSEILKFGVLASETGSLEGSTSKEDLEDVLRWMEKL